MDDNSTVRGIMRRRVIIIEKTKKERNTDFFQDFESPTILNLSHCKKFRFPDYCLFNSTHNSYDNSKKKHSSKTLRKGTCKSGNRYCSEWHRFKPAGFQKPEKPCSGMKN